MCCFVMPIPVNATLTETRQFYTLYNTLEDQKAYMEKEVKLSTSFSLQLVGNNVHTDSERLSPFAVFKFLRRLES